MINSFHNSDGVHSHQVRHAKTSRFTASLYVAGSSVLLFLLVVALGGCSRWNTRAGPSIEFTSVPPASEGGPDTAGTIEGRVIGRSSGQQIVLFARSGQWWVQPVANRPFTKIQADSTWSSATHLGTEYAALLVEPGYHPSATMDSLPTVGAAVVAVASVKGGPAPAEIVKTVRFSGYEWKVRTAASNRGGSITHYDPENVWTDERGALHLRIANSAGRWTCAEVSLTRSLGYGMYRFVVRDSSQLEPAVVLSMFTWDDSGQDPTHREFGVEIARWGDPQSKNAQYAVQPYYMPTNVSRFMVPAGIVTHSFLWAPGTVSFRTARGADEKKNSSVLAEHVFTSGVPTAGGELIHLNLYVFGGAGTPPSKQTEVVFEKFEYLP